MLPLSRGRPRRRQHPLLLLSALLWAPALVAFNLDEEKLTVYSGPPGSYFGYAVDFYIPDPSTVSVLVGAPKANTTQPDIVEGGAVYYCAWPAARCRQIPFDNTRHLLQIPAFENTFACSEGKAPKALSQTSLNLGNNRISSLCC